jgi:hypothetical protein
MAIRLNWDRVKQLHAELTTDGFKNEDKLTATIIEKGGKPRKVAFQFKDMLAFFWSLIDNETFQVITFIVQDVDGKIIYRHKQMVGNEEVPNGGNSNVISHWPALTEDERQMYMNILISQIASYER